MDLWNCAKGNKSKLRRSLFPQRVRKWPNLPWNSDVSLKLFTFATRPPWGNPDWHPTTSSIIMDTSLVPLDNPPRWSLKNWSSLDPKRQKGEAANMLFSGSQALRPRLVTESQLRVLVGPQTLWERKLPLSLARSLTRGHYSREIRGCASTPEQRRQQLPTVPSAPLATPDPTFLTGGSPGAGGMEGTPWCWCECCFQKDTTSTEAEASPTWTFGPSWGPLAEVPHWMQWHASSGNTHG